MGLQMIFGRSHSGKTQYILDKALELYNNKKPLIYVVPEQFTHLAEKKLISKLGSIEYGMAEVMSFERIATRINKLYPSAKKHLTPSAKSLIMSEIISELNLEYYKNTASNNGFISVCSGEIAEFKKYNMSHEDVLNASEKIEDRGLALKLKDLSKIYKAYEEAISGSFSDSDDALGILADNLYTHNPYSGFTFLFDEFSSFNPIEKKVISSLSMQCDMIYMTFCLDADEKYKYLFKPTLDTAKSIEKICKDALCEVKKSIILDKTYYDNEEMAFLEENIFASPNKEFHTDNKNICVYTSENPYTEIIGVASKIKSLVCQENVRYKDIGIVCADIDMYSHIFRTVFKSFDIPCFIDEKTDVLKHSIICFVMTVIDVFLLGYNSESITNFLKSGHLNIPRKQIIDTDNFILAANASKNTWLNDDRWQNTLEKYCDGDKELYISINEIREKYILPLAFLHDEIKGKKTVKYITEKLYKYLINSSFDKNVYDYIKYFKSNDNAYMAKQYESVWKILIEALDVLVLILGDKKVNLSSYRNYLYTAFGEQKIGLIPTSLDLVIIGDVKRSKSEQVLYQFVVGMCDGSFPTGVKDNFLINDADKILISNAGYEFSPDKYDKALFERFLTYSSLCHPIKQLILSYPFSDTAFNSTRPSFTLTVLKNIFPHLKEKPYIQINDKYFLSSKNYALEYLCSSAYNLSDGKDGYPYWQDIYAYFKDNNPQIINFMDNCINKPKSVTKLDKKLTDTIFSDEFYSTISRIGRYNSCKYSYYLEYMLGLKDKKTYGPESTDVGTFVHTIIEKVFKHMNDTFKNIATADKDYFIKVTEPLFKEYLPILYPLTDDLSPKEKFRLDIIKSSVINSLLHIKSHISDSAFKPIGHEITFDDNNIGCIELELSNGKKLKLTGKIDRADSFENENGTYIRVIDYKTGNKTFSLSDVFYGLDIQLVVYLNTLVKKTQNAHHAGALFFKIHNPTAEFTSHPQNNELLETLSKLNAMTGLVADDEYVLNAYGKLNIKSSKKVGLTEFSLLSDYVEDNIKISARNLSDGNIDIDPYIKSGFSPCNYCPYHSICGFTDGKTGDCRNLNSISDKEIWQTISKSKKGGDGK